MQMSEEIAMHHTQRKALESVLITTAMAKCPSNNARAHYAIEVISAIVAQGFADLTAPNERIKADAKEYFNGWVFKSHAKALNISRETLLYIAENIQKVPEDFVLDDDREAEELL
jgi:hypothetical protein